MKWVLLIMFLLVSILMLAARAVDTRDIYIATSIFLAAEYIECAIAREK